MIYTNNVDNREYLFTDKFAPSEQPIQIEGLEKMGDFDRDTHLMWLLQHKYIVDSYKGKAITDKECEVYDDEDDNRIKKLDSIIAQVKEIERVYGWGIHYTNLIFSDLLDDVKSIKDKNYEPGRHQIEELVNYEETA
jgi:hypothetical protein